MALVYDVSLTEKCSKTECTEEELKKKPADQKKVLNDCDDAGSSAEDSKQDQDTSDNDDAVDESVLYEASDFYLYSSLDDALDEAIADKAKSAWTRLVQAIKSFIARIRAAIAKHNINEIRNNLKKLNNAQIRKTDDSGLEYLAKAVQLANQELEDTIAAMPKLIQFNTDLGGPVALNDKFVKNKDVSAGQGETFIRSAQEEFTKTDENSEYISGNSTFSTIDTELKTSLDIVNKCVSNWNKNVTALEKMASSDKGENYNSRHMEINKLLKFQSRFIAQIFNAISILAKQIKRMTKVNAKSDQEALKAYMNGENPANESAVDESIEDLGAFAIDESADDKAALAAVIGIGVAAIGTVVACTVKVLSDVKTAKKAIAKYEDENKDLIPIEKLTRKKFRLSGDPGAPVDYKHEYKAKKIPIIKKEISQFNNNTGAYVWYDGNKPLFAITLEIETVATPVTSVSASGDVSFGTNISTVSHYKYYPMSRLANKYAAYYSVMASNDMGKKRKRIGLGDRWMQNLINDYREDKKKQKQKNIHETVDSMPYDERIELAKSIVEDAQAERSFAGYLQESCEALCLDEGYIKNVKDAHALTSGKKMKEAKAHAKAAKSAVKNGDYDTAVSEQRKYVEALKALVEDCNSIEDDTKMIVIANSVMKGMLSTLASLLAGILLNTTAARYVAARKAGKSSAEFMKDATDMNTDTDVAQNLKDYKDSTLGKAALAVTALISVVIGIISGKQAYRKNMLKYTGGIEKENKWEVPKSRVDAQQKLRRMVKLAEDLLKEYEDIKKVEDTHK